MGGKINPIEVRRSFPGFVGGDEIAKKASNSEIIWLVKKQNEAGEIANKLSEIQEQIRKVQVVIGARSG